MADGTEQTTQSSSQGGSQQQTSAGGGQQGTGSQTSQTTQSNPGATPSPTPRPEYVPESHWDSTTAKVKDDKAFAAFVNEHVAFKAAEDSRKLTLPATAEAYEAKLPESFKPPEGVKFEFNTADPLLAQARAVAHSAGMTQEKFSELLGVYAGAQVASQEAIKTARNAEVAKLGAAGPARVDALTTFFKAHLGDAEGTQLMSRAFLASDVHILEKLVVKMSTQGGASLTGTGREPPAQQGKVTEEQYEKMSNAQRLDYAQSFDQSQFQKKAG